MKTRAFIQWASFTFGHIKSFSDLAAPWGSGSGMTKKVWVCAECGVFSFGIWDGEKTRAPEKCSTCGRKMVRTKMPESVKRRGEAFNKVLAAVVVEAMSQDLARGEFRHCATCRIVWACGTVEKPDKCPQCDGPLQPCADPNPEIWDEIRP